MGKIHPIKTLCVALVMFLRYYAKWILLHTINEDSLLYMCIILILLIKVKMINILDALCTWSKILNHEKMKKINWNNVSKKENFYSFGFDNTNLNFKKICMSGFLCTAFHYNPETSEFLSKC